MFPKKSLSRSRKAKVDDAGGADKRIVDCTSCMDARRQQSLNTTRSVRIWLTLAVAAIVTVAGVALVVFRKHNSTAGFAAAELLDRARWQQGNVSASLFPDGHPIKHFDSKNSVVWGMAERQQWEAETFRAFRAVLSDEAARRPGAWVLDLGGWIGVTGLYAAQFAPQVLAFEPDPAARSELAANVFLNPLFEPRIRIVDKCVSHEHSSVTMKGDPGASWSSILFFDDKGTLEHWQVECKPLPNHLDGADVVFLKMDIEGAEARVLPSLRRWLADHGHPPVLVSMHRWLWQDRPAAETGMLAVFRDYAHVYNAKLEEMPRESLTVEWMASAEDPAFLLASKRYEFPTLHTGLFAVHGGYLPLAPQNSLRLRGSQASEGPRKGTAEDDDVSDEHAASLEEQGEDDEMAQLDDQDAHAPADDDDRNQAADDAEQPEKDAASAQEQEGIAAEDDDDA